MAALQLRDLAVAEDRTPLKLAPAAPLPPPHSEPVPRTVTLRAVLLGLVLIPPSAWWIAQIEFVRYSDSPTIPALFFHCITTLVLLTGANGLLRRFRRAWALQPSELLVAYGLQVVGSNLAGADQLQILITTLAWPAAHANAANHWGDRLLPNIPQFLLPDPRALPALFSGNSSLYAEGHWRAWLLPASAWICFVAVLAGTMLCLMSIMRRRWDHERLSYPLAEVPLAIVMPERRLFKQRLFWMAFAIAAGTQVLSFAAMFIPNVPSFPLNMHWLEFEGIPWEIITHFPVCFYLFALGLAFLLPLDLSFSCWFFFLFSRLELVTSSTLGLCFTRSEFPYLDQQLGGAYLAFAGCLLWQARGYLAGVWRAAVTNDRAASAGEPMTYRTAVFGFAAGMVTLCACLVAFGMRVWVAGAYLALFILIVLTVARFRAEMGLPTMELPQGGADDMLTRVLGTDRFTHRELGAITLTFFVNRTHRQIPITHQADLIRIGSRAGMDQRRFSSAIMCATVLGAAAAFWALLHVGYQTGMSSAHFLGPAAISFGEGPWSRMDGWIQSPSRVNPSANAAYVVGAAITILLMFLRSRFLWWPLHPAGFVAATASPGCGIQRLWLPLMLAWAIKGLLLRYAGLRGYRAALPFFLGLVLGEFCFAFLRTLVDLAFGLYLPRGSGILG